MKACLMILSLCPKRNKDKRIEIKADEGKMLLINKRVVAKLVTVPVDYNLSLVEEIDEIIIEEEEEYE